jgi:Xaa-Pro dipeptidase
MADSSLPREQWFSREEYQRRLQKVRASIGVQDLDALIVFSPANVYYLCGHHSIDSWEFRAAVVTPDRDPIVLLFQFERGRFLASSWLEGAEFYGPGERPTDALVQAVDAAGLADALVGVEQYGVFARPAEAALRARIGGVRLTPVTGLVDRVRLRKSDEELRCIRRAAELTQIGLNAAKEEICEGAHDHDVVAAAMNGMLRAGSHHPVMPPTVAAGYRSGLSHSEHDSVVLGKGDPVFVELSGCWRHYSAPLMYTTTVGPPSDEWKRIYDVAQRVAATIVASAKPGEPSNVVAEKARAAMRGIEDRVQFHYNFGYSIGASFPPHWLEESNFHIKLNNSAPLEAGMVFHSALTMRVLGRFAAGTSRTFEITDSGVRVLTGGDPVGET